SASCVTFCRSSFFFSSRRRHTSWPRDWSSDVCSSDLICENTLPGNTFFALNQPCAKGSLKGRKRKALDASRGTKPQYIQHIVGSQKAHPPNAKQALQH